MRYQSRIIWLRKRFKLKVIIKSKSIFILFMKLLFRLIFSVDPSSKMEFDNGIHTRVCKFYFYPYLTLSHSYAVRKDKYMACVRSNLTSTQTSLLVAQQELEAPRLENASLSKSLIDCANFGLKAISKSFENALKKVDQFHHSFYVSREYISLNQMLNDGKVVSLLAQPSPIFCDILCVKYIYNGEINVCKLVMKYIYLFKVCLISITKFRNPCKLKRHSLKFYRMFLGSLLTKVLFPFHDLG